MAWNIFLSLLAGISQFGNSFLGWKVTGQELTPQRRKLYDALFIICGAIGIASIGILAFRSGREERVHLSLRLDAVYSEMKDGKQIPTLLAVNQPLAFNLFWKNVGNGSAYEVDARTKSFIEPDFSADSQREVVSRFTSWLGAQPHSSTSLPKDQETFITASGEILSPEDLANILDGRRVAFVLASVRFKDDFGSHEARLCRSLLPPTLKIWGACPYEGEN